MNTPRLVAPFKFDPPSGVRGTLQRWAALILVKVFWWSRWRLGGRGSQRLIVLAGMVLRQHGRIVFRMTSGARLVVGHRDGYWLRHALFNSEYEPELDAFLARLLRPTDAFVDCGANIGLWSVSAAQVVDRPERVVAVEPARLRVDRLQINWNENGRRFTPLQRAVSTRDGDEITLHVSVDDHASSTTLAELAPTHAHAERVETVALTSLLASLRSTAGIMVVKLDVEGLEEELFGSLDPSVDVDVVVVYEDHGKDTTHAASTAAQGRGFELAMIGDDGRLIAIVDRDLAVLDVLKVNPHVGYNLVAVAPAGQGRDRLQEILEG